MHWARPDCQTRLPARGISCFISSLLDEDQMTPACDSGGSWAGYIQCTLVEIVSALAPGDARVIAPSRHTSHKGYRFLLSLGAVESWVLFDGPGDHTREPRFEIL